MVNIHVMFGQLRLLPDVLSQQEIVLWVTALHFNILSDFDATPSTMSFFSLPLLYQLRKERERLRAMMAHLHLPSVEGQPLSAPTSLQSPQSDTAADPRGPQVDSVPCSNSRMNNRHKANEPWSVSKSEPNMWWRVKITCFCPQVRLPQRWWRCCQPVTDLVDFYSWMSCRNMLALS